MKLHTVFITYNRLELTKRAIASYLETVSVPYVVWVSDNGSTDGTKEWLREWMYEDFPESRRGVISSDENHYPGKATNAGWEMGAGPGLIAHWDSDDEPTHLHRADNDWEFLPGWCDEVERCFSENPRLGQLGMRTNEQEGFNARNVGGNCIITRQIWDEGLRYDERPWPKIKAAGYTEDSYMSPKVLRMGWEWGRVRNQCIESLADENPHDPYYRKSWEDRKILKQSLKAYGIEER